MWLGITDRFLTWRQILRRRLFPERVELPERWQAYYWRRVTTSDGNQRTVETITRLTSRCTKNGDRPSPRLP